MLTLNIGGRVVLGIRPEDVKLTPAATNEDNELAGEIRSAAFLGDQFIYEISPTSRIRC